VTTPIRASDSVIRVNGRDYCRPAAPLVVVCLDGSAFEYIREAIAAGATPFLGALVSSDRVLLADAAMPTFTNPNNLSIVTGVSPAVHGIGGNFFLDRSTGRAVMMNDPSFLRAETIPAAFSRAGARVVVITAKDKLRGLLSVGLDGLCVSAEQEGVPVYSGRLSEHVLERGVEIMASTSPDIMYLSTSDYIQHRHAPGSDDANLFYAAVDRQLAALDRLGATLVVTADHGMRAKTDEQHRPRIVFLQTLLEGWLGRERATVILPITDPYVAHHGSLGAFATIYLANDGDSAQVIERLRTTPGVDVALAHDAACRTFELPPDRTGDVVVCADGDTVLGTRSEDHDLSALHGPLRSHGGLAEREVPMLFNRPPGRMPATGRLKNYDAFWVGLNAL
jgi:phosphonoacetate hydrolase